MENEPYLKEESDRILGCAMRVHNEVGHGFHEKPYENALVIEFQDQRIPCDPQRRYEMIYKNKPIGTFIPDLIVFEQIIIDTKVIEKISDHEIGQMMNYLKITGFKLGYILNFKHKKQQWKRVVL